MASMDERLPLTEGTNRVIEDPVPVSGLRSAVQFATEALGGYTQLKNDLNRQKAAREAEEAKTRENQVRLEVARVADTAAKNVTQSNGAQMAANAFLNTDLSDTIADEALPELVDEGNGVFSTAPSSTTPAVQKDITRAAVRSMSIVQAVEQGKMPPITMNAAINAEFRRIREAYPEHVDVILKTFKDTGLDANLFTEAKDAQDWHDFEREKQQNIVEDARKREETYIAAAETAYGADAVTMTREEKIVTGMRIEKLDYDMTQQERKTKAALENAALNEKDKEAAQEELNNSLGVILKTSLYNDAQPYVRQLQQLSDAILRNPNDTDAIQRFQSLGVKSKQLVGTWVEKAVTVAVSRGYRGDTAKLRSELTASWGPVLDLFTGDSSVVNVNMQAVKAVENSLKLNTAEALPVFTALKAAGLKPDEMPSVIQAVQTNPKLAEQLNREVKGYITDFGADRGSTTMFNIVKLLRGDLTLERMDPAQARTVIPTLVDSTRNLAIQYIRNPKDIDGNKVINGIGEITTNVRALGPSNGPRLLYIATHAFAEDKTRQALIHTLSDGNVDRTMALATVQASRGASAQMLNYYQQGMADVNKTSQYFKVKWDNRNGRYVIDDSAKRKAIQDIKRNKGASSRGLTGEDAKFGRLADVSVNANIIARLEAPDDVRRFVMGANENLENAISLGRHDPTTPQATELELRNWYGQGRPLPVEKAGPNVDYDKTLDKMLENADKSLTNALDNVTDDGVTVPKIPVDYTRTSGYKQYAPIVKEAATKYGVPEAVAIALVGKESTFDPTAEGPVIKSGTHKGDRAMGFGQVMAKTAAAYGVTDRASLNPAQQADLAMRVLSDNYKSTGNWKDAVSMYFTGVKYATAKRQGRSDGFNSVIRYVESIL